jgi:DNA-binding GntR family transcriptional regulator
MLHRARYGWPVSDASFDLSIEGSVGKQTTHESVLARLRKAILAGQLPAGTHLVQADVAAQLGVSTTPVREALRDLAAQGLVQLDTFRGAVVKSFDEDDVREVFELRMLLEPLALRKHIEAGIAEELPPLRELQASMDRTKDPIAWLELNGQFHETLANVPGSPRLREFLRTLQDAASVYVNMTVESSAKWMASGTKQHRALIDACARGDADEAAQVAAAHIADTLEVVVRDAGPLLRPARDDAGSS